MVNNHLDQPTGMVAAQLLDRHTSMAASPTSAIRPRRYLRLTAAGGKQPGAERS
jgi:hypothetical protein